MTPGKRLLAALAAGLAASQIVSIVGYLAAVRMGDVFTWPERIVFHALIGLTVFGLILKPDAARRTTLYASAGFFFLMLFLGLGGGSAWRAEIRKQPRGVVPGEGGQVRVALKRGERVQVEGGAELVKATEHGWYVLQPPAGTRLVIVGRSR